MPNIDWNSSADMAWLNAYIVWYLTDDVDETDTDDDDDE